MSKRKFSPKQERKRQKIIDVAVKLFVKNGIQGTSIQLLAKRADVSTGSIYTYFENKEVLIKEVFREIIEEERQFELDGYDDSATIHERFVYLCHRSILFKSTYVDKLKFRQQYIYARGIIGTIDSSEVFAGHPFAILAKDGIEAGIIKPMSLEELFYFSHAGVTGFISWKLFANDGKLSDQDIANVTDMVWDALKAPDQKQP